VVAHFTERELSELRVRLGRSGLAQPTGWLPFTSADFLPGAGTTSAQTAFTTTLSRPCTVHYWYQNVYVATTNDGSNYWTLQLQRLSDSGVVSTLDTSGIAVATSANLSNTGIAGAVTKAHLGLAIEVSKTGSPGTLYLGGPAIFVT